MANGSAVASLYVVNESTRAAATDVSLLPDGTWRATLPLATGANRIRVVARARDGSEREARLVLHREPGAGDAGGR
jgi:predicted component of type VI protein secretion system